MTTIEETAWNEITTAVVNAAREILKQGPLPLPQLTSMLQEQGALDALINVQFNGDVSAAGDDDLPDYVDNILNDVPDLWTSSDDVAFSLPDFLETVVVTHRLTHEEITKGYLVTTFDLGALTHDLRHEDELRTRSNVIFERHAQSDAGEDTWQGPTDWLTEFSAGDIIAVTRKDMVIDLAKVDEPSNDKLQMFAQKVMAALELGLESADYLLLQTMAAFPEDFAKPQPPFSAILDAAGVNRSNSWISKPGSTMTAPRDEILFDEMVNRYALDDCCVDAFAELVDATAPGAEKPMSRQAIEHGLAMRAFADWSVDVGRIDEARTTLEASKHQPAVAFMDGVVAENALQFADARARYDDALKEDKQFVPAASMLAELTADAGDHATTLMLLRRIEADSRERGFLEAQLSKHTQTGRNDACPCGSGKKYKACCLNKPMSLTADARLEWLITRVHRFTTRCTEIIRELENACVLAFDDPREAFRAHGATLLDFAMFEGGGLQAFAGQRSELLDETDRRLLGALLDSSRQLSEDLVVSRVIENDGKSVVAGTSFSVPATRQAEVQALIEDDSPMRDWIEELAVEIQDD
jgi:hypothetical protein